MQFNHKPTKMLLTEKKKGVSPNGQTPNIIGICSYYVLVRPVFEWNQVLLRPELTPGGGGVSSLPMVSTTRNLITPPTPLDGGVCGDAPILAYLVSNMSRSQSNWGFGHYFWPIEFGRFMDKSSIVIVCLLLSVLAACDPLSMLEVS